MEQKHPEIITRVVLFYRVLMKFLHVTTKNKLYKKEDETRGLGRRLKGSELKLQLLTHTLNTDRNPTQRRPLSWKPVLKHIYRHPFIQVRLILNNEYCGSRH